MAVSEQNTPFIRWI